MKNNIKVGASLLGMAFISVPLLGCSQEDSFESAPNQHLTISQEEMNKSVEVESVTNTKAYNQDELHLAMTTLRIFYEDNVANDPLVVDASKHYLAGLMDALSIQEIIDRANQPLYLEYQSQARHELALNAKMAQEDQQRQQQKRSVASPEQAPSSDQANAEQDANILSKLVVVEQRFSLDDGVPMYEFVFENNTEHAILSAKLMVSMESGEPNVMSVQFPRPLEVNDTQRITLRVNRPEDRMYEDESMEGKGAMTAHVISAETVGSRLEGEQN